MRSKIKFGLILLAIVAVTGFSKANVHLTPSQILNLVNLDRQRQGLTPLTLNPELNLAAFAKASDMISNHYFAHTSPEGTTPWYWIKSLGYNYSYAGENLAVGYSNANDLVKSWMNSPEHRANIMDPNYHDMGLAVVQGQNSTLVVQMFGATQQVSIIDQQ